MLFSTLRIPFLHPSTLTSLTLNTYYTRLKRLLHENGQLPTLFMCYCLSSLFEALSGRISLTVAGLAQSVERLTAERDSRGRTITQGLKMTEK